MQHRLHYVRLLPITHSKNLGRGRVLARLGRAGVNEQNPAQSIRQLRWLIAGLVFLALFLVSLRAIGWV